MTRSCYLCYHAEILHSTDGCLGTKPRCECPEFEPAPEYHCSPNDRATLESLRLRLMQLRVEVMGVGINIAGNSNICKRLDAFERYIEFAADAIEDIRNVNK
jgi:hypothetical protein